MIQEQAQQGNNQSVTVQKAVVIQQKPVEHPPQNYSLTQVYMIRKQSIFHSNELISRRLSRCFQRIKRLKQNQRDRQIYSQYDQDNSGIRKSWRKVHELFKLGSKVNDITQKKIDKMRARIDKVKKQVHKDQIFMSRDIDISKVYIRAVTHQPTSSQKNLQK